MNKLDFIKLIHNLIIFQHKAIKLSKDYNIDLYDAFHVHLYECIDLLTCKYFLEEGANMINQFVYDDSEKYEFESREYYEQIDVLYCKLENNAV
jgi:hypothetical protein